MYVACWTEDGGIASCGHEHETIADALQCLVLDGSGFIRACESGRQRPLTEPEVIDFLRALSDRRRRSLV